MARAGVVQVRGKDPPHWDSAETQLAQLARSGGPLRRVLAALAEQLVARRAFEPLGYARLGDYARERLGVSARTLQEFRSSREWMPSWRGFPA